MSTPYFFLPFCRIFGMCPVWKIFPHRNLRPCADAKMAIIWWHAQSLHGIHLNHARANGMITNMRAFCYISLSPNVEWLENWLFRTFQLCCECKNRAKPRKNFCFQHGKRFRSWHFCERHFSFFSFSIEPTFCICIEDKTKVAFSIINSRTCIWMWMHVEHSRSHSSTRASGCYDTRDVIFLDSFWPSRSGKNTCRYDFFTYTSCENLIWQLNFCLHVLINFWCSLMVWALQPWGSWFSLKSILSANRTSTLEIQWTRF